MINVIKDVSTLSTIPDKTIVKLLKKFVYSICSGVEEDIIQENNVTAANIGLGILYIKHQPGEEIEYKFVPNKYLQTNLIETIENKKNPLENVLNDSLVKKLINTYKDLC